MITKSMGDLLVLYPINTKYSYNSFLDDFFFSHNSRLAPNFYVIVIVYFINLRHLS